MSKKKGHGYQPYRSTTWARRLFLSIILLGAWYLIFQLFQDTVLKVEQLSAPSSPNSHVPSYQADLKPVTGTNQPSVAPRRVRVRPANVDQNLNTAAAEVTPPHATATQATTAQATPAGNTYLHTLFTPRFSPIGTTVPSNDPLILTPGQPNRLTKKFVEMIASPDRYILMAKSNLHRVDFAMNWAYHLHTLGIFWYAVMATSREAYDTLLQKGVNTFLAVDGDIQQDAIPWGSPMFNKLSAQHIQALATIAEYGFTVFYSDTDAAWLRDPSPFIQGQTAVDIALSSDGLRPSPGTTALTLEEPAGFSHSNLNIGMMLVRPTPNAIALLRFWYDELTARNPNNDLDQVVFARLVRRSATLTEPTGAPLPQRTWKGWGRNVSIGVLPIAYFSSGHTYFVGQWFHREGEGALPYLMHATFTFSQHDGKRHRLRDALMWVIDPPEYYSSAEGYLYYEPEIPDDWVKRATPAEPDPPVACQLKKEGAKISIDLVHHQLRQLRSAFQIAQMTGRVLVLPKFICTLDHWYGCHDGSIPGAQTQPPFICPFDYLADVSRWNAGMDPAKYGPNVKYRESSFFDNPRFPRTQLDSKVIVTVGTACDEPGATCLTVKEGMDEDALRAALLKAAEFRVMKLMDPVRVFNLYTNPAKLAQLQLRLNEMTTLWCCVREERPQGLGHIYYDMFTDIDHVDKAGRTWKANAWRPLLGDDKN